MEEIEWPDQQEYVSELLEGQPFPYIVIIGAGQDGDQLLINTQYNLSEEYREAFVSKLEELADEIRNYEE